MRLFKLLIYLLILGAAGFVGFAYFGDLSPEQTEMRIPLELDDAD